MGNEPFYRLPDAVAVPVADVADAIVRLDDVVDELEGRSDRALADRVDLVIGRMTRWLWPLLQDLDDEGGQ